MMIPLSEPILPSVVFINMNRPCCAAAMRRLITPGKYKQQKDNLSMVHSSSLRTLLLVATQNRCKLRISKSNADQLQTVASLGNLIQRTPPENDAGSALSIQDRKCASQDIKDFEGLQMLITKHGKLCWFHAEGTVRAVIICPPLNVNIYMDRPRRPYAPFPPVFCGIPDII